MVRLVKVVRKVDDVSEQDICYSQEEVQFINHILRWLHFKKGGGDACFLYVYLAWKICSSYVELSVCGPSPLEVEWCTSPLSHSYPTFVGTKSLPLLYAHVYRYTCICTQYYLSSFVTVHQTGISRVGLV